MDLLHRLALRRVGVGLGVRHQLRVAGDDLVDDPEPGRPQRPARLGQVDDDVDDVGGLRLGGTVGEADVGVDALLGEEALGHPRVLTRDLHAVAEVLDALDR